MNELKKVSYLLIFALTATPVFAQVTSHTNDAGNKPDILDSMISLVIILFILSVISEKITNLIRKYSPFINPGHRLHGTWMSTVWKNVRKKQKDSTLEDDKIEREVNSLSFFIGLIITIIFCVDLFKMFSEPDPRSTLYWTTEKWHYYWAGNGYWVWRVPLLIVSFCLTGFFLTFGSKFFHDLLDTLFQVKNLKRKLNDSRTFTDPQSIEEFEDFIKTPESKLASLAVEQQATRISAINGVVAVGSGYMNQNGEKVGCLEIHVLNDTVPQSLSREYAIKLSSGLTVKVPSNIIVIGNYPAAAFGASGKIANRTVVLGFGTLGGIVKDKLNGDKYILSCHHVLNGEINWRGLSQSKEIVLNEDGNLNPVAELTSGFRTNEFDTALARLLPGSNLSNELIGNPTKIRKVENSDAINELSVSVFGGETGREVKGILFNNTWNTKFRYPKADGTEELWPLNDLIVLTNPEKNNTLTQGGDSGAFVIDKDKNVIGMVVGGDDKFTYAIKMSKIEETFNIQLA